MDKENDDNLHELIKNLEEEISQLQIKVSNENVLKKHFTLHKIEEIDILLKNQLKLESEIEALLLQNSKLLPNDNEILCNIARQKAEDTKKETQLAVESQNEINSNLEREIRNLDLMIKDAESVVESLNKVIENKDEKNEKALLEAKYNKYGRIFQRLRQEFSWYITSRFTAEQEKIFSVENILQVLTEKFLSDPSDPFVKFPEEDNKGVAEFLIRSNIISQHPKDPVKFRLFDFRR